MTGKWELVIVWATGETEVFEYDSEDEAQNRGYGMRSALGEQIEWFGVRPQIRRNER